MTLIGRFWRSERLRRVLVAIMVVYLIVAAGAIVVLLIVSIQLSSDQAQTQTDQHNATVATLGGLNHDEHEIATTLAQVKAIAAQATALAAQVKMLSFSVAVVSAEDHTVIAGLPAADAFLGKLATGLESQIQALCNITAASCAALPVQLP